MMRSEVALKMTLVEIVLWLSFLAVGVAGGCVHNFTQPGDPWVPESKLMNAIARKNLADLRTQIEYHFGRGEQSAYSTTIYCNFNALEGGRYHTAMSLALEGLWEDGVVLLTQYDVKVDYPGKMSNTSVCCEFQPPTVFELALKYGGNIDTANPGNEERTARWLIEKWFKKIDTPMYDKYVAICKRYGQW